MGIDRVRAALLAALLSGAAMACAAPIGWGLVDARQPDQPARVVGPDAPAQAQLMPFVRLTDPESSRIECCLQVQPQATASPVLRYRVGPDRLATQPAHGLSAQLLAAEPSGFVGLVLPPRSGARVLRRSPQQLLLSWSDASSGGRTVQWQVQHCLSSEGLHLWWTDPRAPRAPHQHLYLPLDMAVEADCPAAWLKR